MSGYQVLYRAWRPAVFEDMVGQDPIVQTLRRQVISGHIAHAYLFCGSRGTGKTTASKILARAINCLHPVNGDPCGECECCRAILSDNCMDVQEIDAASNNSVDEVRDLREKVQFPPAMTRYKVYIIDEVHMLSSGAFNALLKTLEEPPEHAVFILATTEPQKLLATILSRCQRFDFRRIPVETIVGRLRTVLSGIGREADDEALAEIARAAEGGMRDALSLLDSCLAYTDGTVTLEIAHDALGTAGRGTLFEFTDALINFDAAKALGVIAAEMSAGADPVGFSKDVTAHLRGLLLAQVIGDASALPDLSPDDAARMLEQSRRVSPQRLARVTDLFLHMPAESRYLNQTRTLLELTAVRACHPEEEENTSVMERLELLEKKLENGTVIRAAAKPQTQSAAPRKEAPVSEAPKAPTETPPQEFLDGLAAFYAGTPSVKPTSGLVRFERMEGDRIVISIPREKAMMQKLLERRLDTMTEYLTQAFGRPVTVSFAGNTAPAAKNAAAGKLSAQGRKTAEKALDMFGRENLDYTD